MINNVIIGGRATTDAEVRCYGPENKKYTKFSLACERDKKVDGYDDVDFFDFISWDEKKAEWAEENVKKGQLYIVKGRLQNNKTEYQGKTIKKNQIIVDSIYFGQPKSTVTQQHSGDGFMDIPEGLDDEMPFN